MRDLAPWLRWLDLRFDHFRDERDGIGMQPVDRLAMKRFTTKQQRFTQAEIVDPPRVCGAERPREGAAQSSSVAPARPASASRKRHVILPMPFIGDILAAPSPDYA